MIITKTPFRISFAGGGSDINSFYSRHEGCVLSATINKYMYICVNSSFDYTKTFIKYSDSECVDDTSSIKHPIIRQILLDYDVQGIEFISCADIPSGTGLGSSSAFTVGALNAVMTYKGTPKSKGWLAKTACKIEIEKLHEPIGKQDQYASSFGGLNFFTFFPDDTVRIEKLSLPKDILMSLEERLLMFYIGGQRSASMFLSQQKENLENGCRYVENIKKMTSLAKQLRASLCSNQLHDFGQILHEGWMLKQELAEGITNERIDHYYNAALKSGAAGGKLLGAGGGGFLLFYCDIDNQESLRRSLADLPELKFSFDHAGTRVIINEKDQIKEVV